MVKSLLWLYIYTDDDAMGNATQQRRLRRKCDCRNIENAVPLRTCPLTQSSAVITTPFPTSGVTVAPSNNLLPMGKRFLYGHLQVALRTIKATSLKVSMATSYIISYIYIYTTNNNHHCGSIRY